MEFLTLIKYEDKLRVIFELITYDKDGQLYFSSKYDLKLINSNIRKAYFNKRSYKSKEEIILEQASLLKIDNLSPEIYTDNVNQYYPPDAVVHKIMKDDKGKLKPDKKTQKLIEIARETHNEDVLKTVLMQYVSHINKDNSFHYLPYKTDSDFEQKFLKEILSLDDIKRLGLEVYYNGDRALTEFKVKCYKNASGRWSYVGMYTPDFLIIQRKDNQINKVLIVETKGRIYANDPKFLDKKNFMETYFTKKNNEKYGYDKFDYLYLEDTLSDNDWLLVTHNKIKSFFLKEEVDNAN